ncbi:MAG TPA: hypothetical protein VGG13_00035 [Candidatus Saccharimonadales bacterium]|jgi:hypothetical protein
MKSKKFRIIRLLAAYALIIFLLVLSDPAKLPSALLIIPFVLLFFAVYTTAIEITFLFRASEHRVVEGRWRRPQMTAALIAGFPVLLLVLQSIGQLTPWDVLTVITLFIITYFYIIKSSTASLSR